MISCHIIIYSSIWLSPNVNYELKIENLELEIIIMNTELANSKFKISKWKISKWENLKDTW